MSYHINHINAWTMPATGPNMNMDREFSGAGLVPVCMRVYFYQWSMLSTT